MLIDIKERILANMFVFAIFVKGHLANNLANFELANNFSEFWVGEHKKDFCEPFLFVFAIHKKIITVLRTLTENPNFASSATKNLVRQMH